MAARLAFWRVGFVLGAIVSPPDAVAPLAIARRMQLPRRISVILEGEGLANDATALVLYRFAVAAVSVGSFSLAQGGETFTAIIAGEIVWGIGVGWTMLRLRRFMRDPRIEITLSLITPFLAYWPPEHLGGSGVIATVATGLYISWNGPRLISAATRLQGVFFWDFFLFLIEGLVFLFTGLQAQALFARIQDHSLYELTTSAAIVSLVVIARAIRVDVSDYLPAALAHSAAGATRSFAAVAVAVHHFLHRRARDCLARRGAGDPARHRGRRAVSLSRLDLFSHLLRRDGDARLPRVGVALDHSQTRPR